MPKDMSGFAPSKPIDGRPKDESHLVFQRKYDGMRHYLVAGGDGLSGVYSSSGRNVSETFPDVLAYLEDCGLDFIIDAEYVVLDEHGMEDFSATSSVCRSGGKTGADLNRKCGGKFIAFDILYFDGKPSYTLRYADRLGLLWAVINRIEKSDALRDTSFIESIENLKVKTVDEAMALSRANKWEGIVAWKANEPTVVRWNGSKARCDCYKIKDVFEDDFIAFKYELGKGTNRTKVGALFLAQLDHNGEPVYFGKVGTGFTAKDREEALHWEYPCVVRVEYSQITGDSNEPKRKFPVFSRKRSDKSVHECVMKENNR